MVFEKIRVGNLELENRIVMPPMATAKSTEDGKVTDELVAYYGERAANPNVGLIITEHSYISQQGKAHAKQVSISSDTDIDGQAKIVEEIHKYGKKVIAQINHAGSAAFPEVTGMEPVSASAVILPGKSPRGEYVEPKALTQDEIKGIVADFVAAAKRVKAAGFDGVEIHSAHGYFLNQFYSPLTNLRTDEYGGSLDNRLRIHREVIAAVREAVGEDYTIAIRLGGCDYMDGGSTIEDCVYAAKVFERAGVDLIDLSGGMCRFILEGRDEPGYFQDMTSAVKAAVSVPVILTGGVKTLDEAEDLLQKGAADLIGIGRELLKNPKFGE